MKRILAATAALTALLAAGAQPPSPNSRRGRSCPPTPRSRRRSEPEVENRVERQGRREDPRRDHALRSRRQGPGAPRAATPAATGSTGWAPPARSSPTPSPTAGISWSSPSATTARAPTRSGRRHLLHVNDKDGISENPIRPGDFGLGNPFKFPYQTVEAVLPLSDNELAFVNDTNFGSTGRNANLPDYSDFIVVKVK